MTFSQNYQYGIIQPKHDVADTFDVLMVKLRS